MIAGIVAFVLACGAEVTLVGALVGYVRDQRWSEPAAPQAEWADPDVLPSAPAARPSPSAGGPDASPSADVEIRTVTETTRIPFPVQTVEDPTLAPGQNVVRTRGVTGIRTSTYQVTVADGVPTGKRLLSAVVTRAPVSQVIAVGSSTAADCDPNYSGCVPVAEDVDCLGRGNGPAYVSGTVKVTGSDVYRLDRNGNGVGCDERG